MIFSWASIKKPVFVLAPMANITALPFRSICSDMGADIVYTPMLSSNAIIHNPKKTLNIVSFLKSENPVIVQIFGYDGAVIAEAANIVQRKLAPAGIDINLGCPAPKITGNACGSALLQNLPKTTEIMKKIRKGFSGELSVKIRLGWVEFDTLDFAKNLEILGFNALSVHGRTAKQGYRGVADWKAIYRIADKLTIPVMGNGDIASWQDAYGRLKGSNLAGVLIGRSALGNPWIFRAIKERKTINPNLDEIINIITLQANRSIDYVGEAQTMLEMRKHLGWYIRGFDGAQSIRKQAVTISTYKDLLAVMAMLESIKYVRKSSNQTALN